MIPKTIHCCWFGPEAKTSLMRDCAESWKRFCPDWRIVEWSEVDFDLDAFPPYVKEALRLKKWAFASDYARLKVVHEHGGVYLDADVELLGPIDDLVADNAAFAGFDFDGRNVNTGLGFGAQAGDPMLREAMDLYDELHFCRPDGSLFLLANTFVCTPVFIRHGLIQDNTMQRIGNFTVFPREYFCPKGFSYDRDEQELRLGPEARSIHHYALSWLDGEVERRYCEENEREWVEIVNRLTGVRMVPNY